MLTLKEMKSKLEDILSPKRFIHSINVMNTAVELAGKYTVDVDKAEVAGLLHDCARDLKGEAGLKLCKKYGIQIDYISMNQPELIHAPLGSKFAEEEFGIKDKSIVDAIHYHTTGCENMDMLAKIIFVADYIEPGRIFPGVDEARRLANLDINKALLFALDNTINYILSKNGLIHLDTIKARNYIIFENSKTR